MSAISLEIVEVNEHVTGQLWVVDDIHKLASMIAVIALGQAEHAAQIIQELSYVYPVQSRSQFYEGAREQLLIQGSTDTQKEVSQYHRDGFLFECISWIAARQESDENTYMKDPHISSTTQGLDGLIIQMDPVEEILSFITICEDKCTDNPRTQFRDHIMRAFNEHHRNERGRDLLANAIALIKLSGLKGTAATIAADRVYDNAYRTYRAALTVNSDTCTIKGLQKLFKGYDVLNAIGKTQRVGASFIINNDLRSWFQELAENVLRALDEFEAKEATNV
ncbi:hypothetical protein [Paenibacillus daejeonensis]|uniref:hypothetical protein n=1 Tax=Paenibacillus daejeonensis TaxID=135193 RepID=UPI000370CCDF|nr:hypothetical protein [Paenibacillus daejeonensis]